MKKLIIAAALAALTLTACKADSSSGASDSSSAAASSKPSVSSKESSLSSAPVSEAQSGPENGEVELPVIPIS